MNNLTMKQTKFYYREPNPEQITKEINCIYTCEYLDLSRLNEIIGNDHGIRITIEPMREENTVYGSELLLCITVLRSITETPEQCKERYQKEIKNNLLFIQQETENNRLWDNNDIAQSMLDKVLKYYPQARILQKPYGFVIQSKPFGNFLSVK